MLEISNVTRSALLPTLAFLAVSAAPATAGSEPPLYWSGRKVAPDELPESLGAGPRAAVEHWSQLVQALDYRMDLTAEGRLLLVSEDKSRARKHLALAKEVMELYDELVPAAAPTEAVQAAAEEVREPQATPIPEDPDGGPGALFGSPRPTAETRAPTPAEAWGMGAPFEPESETIALFVLRDDEAYAQLLQLLIEAHPELAEWARSAGGHEGFVVQRPLTGAFVLNSKHQEEWSPDHEFVNRLGQLLLRRRFGETPFWVTQGFAWMVELGQQGSIYCFPYRNDFVGVGEHSGWDSRLSRIFRDKERGDGPLSMEDFAHWERGEYVERYALISWGLVSYLCGTRPEGFAAFLDDLRQFADGDNRTFVGDGRWERIQGYEVPIGQQEERLVAHFGEDVWEEATRAFRTRKIPGR